MLFAARGLQGAMGALMAPAALSILTVTFTEPHERHRAFGMYGAVSGVGAGLGLILGGVLTQYASWRWNLLIAAPIAVLAALAAAREVTESRSDQRSGYDIPGAATATVGLLALVYGFTDFIEQAKNARNRSASVACRQQRWGCGALERRFTRDDQEVEQRPSLLPAGGDHRQQPLCKPTPRFAV
jgi:MFS family permease